MPKDKEKHKEYNREYRLAHLEYFANKAREYRKLNPEKTKAYTRAAYLKSKESGERQLHDKAYSKEYRLKNKNIIQAKDSIRHLAKKQRVPQWANLEHIKEIYQACPKEYHVDHIVPLHGTTVCGLHVEYNLQYLTPEENIKKKNRFPYEDYALWQ